MFRGRENHQKPDQQLIDHFRETYRDVLLPFASGAEQVDKMHASNDSAIGDKSIDPMDAQYEPSSQDPDARFSGNGQDGGFEGFGLSMDMGSSDAVMGATDPNPFDGLDQLQFPNHGYDSGVLPAGQVLYPNYPDMGYPEFQVAGEGSDLQMNLLETSRAELAQPKFLDSAIARFRYCAMLRAPTAMFDSRCESAVTYLNKGQAYCLSISDSRAPLQQLQLTRYRTCIRVSFDKEAQRLNPAAHWDLWKNSRGFSEARSHGGRLRAVEFVDAMPPSTDGYDPHQIQLESASLDGFCVTWTARQPAELSRCVIPFRFNFLSTDFSYAKGVKGIPLRLCAKTEVVSPRQKADASTELCFCNVKVFRDHGAERKLANDMTHVRKSIEKLELRIAQARLSSGMGKRRKRNASRYSLDNLDTYHRAENVLQDKSSGDLYGDLATAQSILTSARSVSALDLRGDELDDPDLFPFKLPCKRGQVGDLAADNEDSHGDASVAAQTPLDGSSVSASPHRLMRGWTSSLESSPRASGERFRQPSDSALPEQRRKLSSTLVTTLSGGRRIEAADIDPSYRSPVQRAPGTVACFFIRFYLDDAPLDYHHRAVYLTERTAGNLAETVLQKHDIDPERLAGMVYITQDGLSIVVDDDVVRELPEGHVMDAWISRDSLEDVPGSYKVALTF